MLIRNMMRKYYEEAGDDGADSGGAWCRIKRVYISRAQLM